MQRHKDAEPQRKHSNDCDHLGSEPLVVAVLLSFASLRLRVSALSFATRGINEK